VVETPPPLIFDPPPLDPYQAERRSIGGLLASMRFGRAGGSRPGMKGDRK
jgi:hypothetical protein